MATVPTFQDLLKMMNDQMSKSEDKLIQTEVRGWLPTNSPFVLIRSDLRNAFKNGNWAITVYSCFETALWHLKDGKWKKCQSRTLGYGDDSVCHHDKIGRAHV